MTEELFEILEIYRTARCFTMSDRASGLRAFLVLDNLTLGPAAGGVRTLRYETARAALEDAQRLARAMTIKCALAGLDAGGGKCVVLAHDSLNRQHAFEKLGELIEELGGIFRTAGDLGTTADDLAAMARKTQYVHTNEGNLSASVGRGVLRAIEACARIHGLDTITGLRIAVQGCGSIGSAVARELALSGARVFVSDINQKKVQFLAGEIGAEVIPSDEIFVNDVDVISPCAVGGVLTPNIASEILAWAVCGAANNILAEPAAEQILLDRNILYVPDVISSAGAVIEGIGRTVMSLSNRSRLVDKIGGTTYSVLEEARQTGKLPTEVAEAKAWQRIYSAKRASKPS